MKASLNLIRAVLSMAPRFRVVHGKEAPSSLDQLRMGVGYIPAGCGKLNSEDVAKGFNIILQSGSVSIPVSGDFCEGTIWPSPEINQAFRAMHDAVHLAGHHEFDLAGEYATALDTDRLLVEYAPYLNDDERRLLFLEVVAQAEHHARRGKFPKNQIRFMEDAMLDGIIAASACEGI